MGNFQDIAKEIIARGEEIPDVELNGYIYDLETYPIHIDKESSMDKRIGFLEEEINKNLPEYATWQWDKSSIILPMDKADEFMETIAWENIKEKVHKSYLEADEKGYFKDTLDGLHLQEDITVANYDLM